MRLFEAIVDANHRAVAGDQDAGLHPGDFADELPVIALTCIDPRLNAFFPNALALPAEKFIWLRNAGNIITGPLSSTMRSLALACAVKGGKEIAIIGHTDCQVAKTTAMQLLEKLKEQGIDRHALPDNLNDFFGMFASERQNILKACDFVRHSPLIGPRIPVHGFLIDIETGKLDWIVNGYEVLQLEMQSAKPYLDRTGTLSGLKDFEIGEMKFPDMKIGEVAMKAGSMVSSATENIGTKSQREIPIAEPPVQVRAQPPKIPVPPPISPRLHVNR